MNNEIVYWFTLQENLNQCSGNEWLFSSLLKEHKIEMELRAMVWQGWERGEGGGGLGRVEIL